MKDQLLGVYHQIGVVHGTRKEKIQLRFGKLQEIVFGVNVQLFQSLKQILDNSLKQNEKNPQGKSFPKANSIFVTFKDSIFLPHQLLPEQKKGLKVDEDINQTYLIFYFVVALMRKFFVYLLTFSIFSFFGAV